MEPDEQRRERKKLIKLYGSENAWRLTRSAESVVGKCKQTQGVIDSIGSFLISFVFETIKKKQVRFRENVCVYRSLTLAVFFIFQTVRRTGVSSRTRWMASKAVDAQKRYIDVFPLN